MEDKTQFIIPEDIVGSGLWKEEADVLKLFIYLLSVAHREKQPLKMQGFDIKYGEIFRTLSEIANDNEYIYNRQVITWSRQLVKRHIETLKRLKLITVLANVYGTHIHIIAYHKYHNLKKTSKPAEKKTTEEKINEYNSRYLNFKDRVMAYGDRYSETMLDEFLDYWTEPNKSKSKMRFEMQPTWDLQKRLIRWEKNQARFGRQRSIQI